MLLFKKKNCPSLDLFSRPCPQSMDPPRLECTVQPVCSWPPVTTESRLSITVVLSCSHVVSLCKEEENIYEYIIPLSLEHGNCLSH